MFKASNSTVFILGAGASWHYGYPTGETLVEKVKEKAFIAARRMGGAQRYPSTAVGEDDGFREGAQPIRDYVLHVFQKKSKRGKQTS